MAKIDLPQVETHLYINGKWLEGSEGTFEVKNPATGEILATVQKGGEKETKEAIQAANKAFEGWSQTSPAERAKLMNKMADLVENDSERLAKIMTMEQGKPLSQATAEIQTNVENLRWNAAEGQRILGDIVPSPTTNQWQVRKQPVGVVGAITPWNFPSNMIIRKISPAIAAGCTVILKPAKATPLSALALMELFDQAGFPEGVVNIVMGDSSTIGKILSESDDIQKITFTGSTEVGQILNEQAAPTLKKVSMELGGHAPFIIFPDADLELATEMLIKTKFINNGQVCTSPNRIFIHKEIKQKATDLIMEKMKGVSVGNGLDDPTTGPLINGEGIEKIEEQLKDAVDKGAQILCGGKRLTEGEYVNGFFFEPTVLDGVTKEMTIFYEETFGPVIPLITFEEEDQVIKDANDTIFGLASYFFSTNIHTVDHVSNQLQYGMVGVNDTAISNSATPFGGVKHSGFGRENGTYGVEEYIEVKFVTIRTAK
ncbi:NAD-dependent succinate-semialdehyde dehydrogenase [Enterococcus durans]|uniref:NAD-dependent succinate-semialdehyde dehydrogenase n=1 Tax=Enterococcus durans TaxID=53345 RepID=UPI0023315986|nr:NAD-dependent succinate-semialdehyde dehydrogenase [Enterococcus durans]MDB1652797.1 NAD-dependent succinate-semialdehyde dehydrogenase [Enterococcus durans]MDB1655499.1 NAD-dependent succinate-semialdehyde dehydrogenase [Enterococcus durans]MDB1664685.1 NAD-dependent succinate-semialdehyde dehydrogenase [Enterococcus durans]MDB1668701.1 NAD-dependent succinate-semialdehyde dehydrogenase [Enterococcus durans]MDB1671392.1 NAD-dependent succinate-semialdehyde dehydrogenase [Enterococcus duran